MLGRLGGAEFGAQGLGLSCSGGVLVFRVLGFEFLIRYGRESVVWGVCPGLIECRSLWHPPPPPPPPGFRVWASGTKETT